MTGFLALLGLTRAGFTAPSFAMFTHLVTGWVCAPGRRTVTAMITAGDPAGRRAHDAYHRFVRDGAWSMHRLWQVLTRHLVTRFCPDGAIELACDAPPQAGGAPSLFHHEGRKVAGAGVFRDAVRSTLKKVVYARGLNLVVITLTVHPPWGGWTIALPDGVRVHRKHDATTTVANAETMLDQIASWLPGQRVHVVTDGAYATLAGADLARVDVTSRMRRDAALYKPAPPRTGRRGRPRLRGERLPTPAQLSEQTLNDQWTTIRADQRGTTITRMVHTRDVLRYKVNRHALVRLVIVRDPAGVQPDDYIVTTDRHASAADVVSRYGDRWSVEVCFRDVKQFLGGDQPQSWTRRGPERAAALALWLHATTWCWYLTSHPDGQTWTPRPWYPRKKTPSFLDALATLRRTLWAQRITHMPSPTGEDQQTTAVLTEAVRVRSDLAR
ncbi:IS701 family transposase [Leekyejoonella antrihumi]|uniref:IS701 family transposase n=1 Tax=Leekyejoonella antrihumi TaxID=1660198 RepID=UPI0016487C5C|nr:transposase [Leekyejoonella antrihumi]